ncbi:TetR/AcrR family transcriptional regulator [Devosia sp. BK]|uniref:TetR/AcrR family transcriptional regulator n=1 Tax=Devosia sp. BK TaxID=2871706 RepID=UPI0029395B10|nr:WHG domain-containing protein [Devosia sp. BK]MDV3251963.1 TetR/AcrR family transcriptional regulator [Devosia sp. BK]
MASYHHGSLRTALLSAAEKILQREGINALTLRAAAREAGVSHTAPAHHFNDLAGLLSALAALGFSRLHDFARAEAGNVEIPDQLLAHARGYIAFARAHPELFKLMFRSERLDWDHPDLASAAAHAYSLLTPAAGERPAHIGHSQDALADTMARWSYVHGLAMLLIDGRLSAGVSMSPGADEDTLIADLIKRLELLEGRGRG